MTPQDNEVFFLGKRLSADGAARLIRHPWPGNVRELRNALERAVLITGATGTGSELVANAIHDYAHRKAGPFIAVNCASHPFRAVGKKLFGHVKGAFTEAVSERLGGLSASGPRHAVSG